MAPLNKSKSVDTLEVFRIFTGVNFISAGDLPKYSKVRFFIAIFQFSLINFCGIYWLYTAPTLEGSTRFVNVIHKIFVLLNIVGVPWIYYVGKVPQWKNRRILENRLRKMKHFLKAGECPLCLRRGRNLISVIIVAMLLCCSLFHEGQIAGSTNYIDLYNWLLIGLVAILVNIEVMIYLYYIKDLLNSFTKIANDLRMKIYMKAVDEESSNMSFTSDHI